ncbi:protein translocase subunit SecF [Hyphomicrobium zavarzinii]|jgi:preprotein translocase SecF subunit|uniref:protein translocase subunit SecF n=1 Tax=Hyphomicrobium zavarzinii TaxID=48292 RepID=UPI000378B19F|nr:protein translocase subunit SecF [Hyphomicrobium zavarzinii]
MFLVPDFKGNDFFPHGTRLPFMDYKGLCVALSIIAMVLSFGIIMIKGFNYGVDFKGGSLIEVRAKSGKADIGVMRDKLATLGLGDVQIQSFGSEADALIRIEQQPGEEEAQQAAANKVLDTLGSDYEQRRIEVVGPAVSSELRTTGLIAVLASIAAIVTYVWFRFEWQFSVGVVLGLFHDVLVTAGIFSLFQLAFDLSIVAALLTILGYSVNDSVVVADRIRENLRKYKKMPLTELLNLSINETLSRTILTGVTTIAVLFALFFLGGEVMQNFTFAMLFGVIIGTYSSIFISAPVIDYLGIKRDWSDETQKAAAGTPARP